MNAKETQTLNELTHSIRELAQALKEHKKDTEETLKVMESKIEKQPFTLERDLNYYIHTSIEKACIEALKSYNSPLIPIIKKAVESQTFTIQENIEEAIKSIQKEDVKKEFATATIKTLVKQMINGTKGVVDSQFHALQQDKTFRARLLIGIDSLVESFRKDYNF